MIVKLLFFPYTVSGISTPGPTRACALVNLACALVKYVLRMNSTQSFAASSDRGRPSVLLTVNNLPQYLYLLRSMPL